MKLKIYSVAEKKPPVDETILLWEIDSKGNILNVKTSIAKISIVEEDETGLIPVSVVKDMIWVNYIGTDMSYSDLWSHSIVDKGE